MSEQTVTTQDLTNIDLYEPQVGYVLLRQWTEEEFTAGGIIIPNADKNKLLVGTVLSVGIEDTKEDECLTLDEGDTVIFGDHFPILLPMLGENLITMKVHDLYARIKPPDQEHTDGDKTKTEN